MKNTVNNHGVLLGEKMDLDSFVAVARHGAKVEFSESYLKRVERARALIEGWVAEERVMYGVTTGFGALCDRAITGRETERLQRNIILSHATSVGEPLTLEQSRAVMLMVLQNLGQGYSGVRPLVLEKYRDFLNAGLTPWAPREGSVGYLSPEAHIALVLMGEGKAYYQGELLPANEALARAGIAAIELSSKEGLALVSGTTSVTGLGALALYDLIKAAKSADIIGAMSLEVMKGIIKAFDPKVMAVRPHPHQAAAAENVRRVLEGSEVIEAFKEARVQDALSLRCIPQLHGAARKTLAAALETVEIEMNSCCDNPIIWPEEGEADVISACNADSSYVGLAMDSSAIAATMLAKMSERRNNRLIDESLSGYPCFLIRNPGLNSGLMIPQYSQAGLLNDMRILSTPASIDNTPTCCSQEDYVAMGYNAAKKSAEVAARLEYILAIELLSVFEAQSFVDEKLRRSRASAAVLSEIGGKVPRIDEDIFLHPHIEYLKELIHSGRLLELVENEIGPLA